jgi:hypothetical protein
MKFGVPFTAEVTMIRKLSALILSACMVFFVAFSVGEYAARGACDTKCRLIVYYTSSDNQGNLTFWEWQNADCEVCTTQAGCDNTPPVAGKNCVTTQIAQMRRPRTQAALKCALPLNSSTEMGPGNVAGNFVNIGNVSTGANPP